MKATLVMEKTGWATFAMEMNDMQARVLQIQASWQSRQEAMKQSEGIRQESNKSEEEKRRIARINEFLQVVPSLYQGKTFDDFIIEYPGQSRIKKTAERYVETFSERLKEGNALKFSGGTGTGKTLLALIMYQALAKSGFKVRYKSSVAFLRDLHDKNFESNAAFERVLDDYNNIHFLIIDEVTEGFSGRGGMLSDWEKKMLFTLIDMRYSKNLCTLVISNRSLGEMTERLGVTTYDRLTEKGLSLIFNWNSYRTKTKENCNVKTQA
jgi:DNA replication protein DnaC